MHIAKTFAAFAFAAALSAGAAQAQTEIKFGHVGEPGSLFDQSAQEFAKRANAKLGTKAKVVVYGSSQLGGDGELMKKLKLGTVDLALPSTVMSSQVPAFGVFEMPYLVKDRDAHGEDPRPGRQPDAGADRGEGRLSHHRRLGERLPPDHQQQAPDREAGRPQGHQAARAGRHLAREDVQGLRRQSEPAGVLRGVRRAADRRDGRRRKTRWRRSIRRASRKCRNICR